MKLRNIFSVPLCLCGLATAPAEQICLDQIGDEHFVARGTEITVQISWELDEPAIGMKGQFTWDHTRLYYVGCEWVDFDPWYDHLATETQPNKLSVVRSGAATTDNGVACILTFGIYPFADYGYAALRFQDDWPRAQLRDTDGAWRHVDDSTYYAIRIVPLGDLNCDGTLNSLDIDPFTAALVGDDCYDVAQPTCNRDLADCNRDGTIDNRDIDAFVQLIVDAGYLAMLKSGFRRSAVSISGDCNGDGSVNSLDISAFSLALSNRDEYARQYPEAIWINADCNHDGRVNSLDVDAFLERIAE